MYIRGDMSARLAEGRPDGRCSFPQLISFLPRSTTWDVVRGFSSSTSMQKGLLWVLGGGWFMGVINRLSVKANEVFSVTENVAGTSV